MTTPIKDATPIKTVLTDHQRATLALWYEVNASLSAYYKLITVFDSPQQAWLVDTESWRQLGIHHTHLKRHDTPEQTRDMIDGIEHAIIAGRYQLIFQDQPEYPAQLMDIYDPPPLLFCRGVVARLQQPQIAMVGSRKPTAHAQKTTFDMAQYLAQSGFVITSGLAIGVDKRAHLGALAQEDIELQGCTIGVMGTGIDICYPNHHDKLFEQIIEKGGCIISELMPLTKPHKHTFPRRNRLVAGLSVATIVVEAAMKSGSLITARLTSEQGKQVFAVPSHIDNMNAEGCHHLIREGATLIYHPEHVLDDVKNQLEIMPYRQPPMVQTSTTQTPISDTLTPSPSSPASKAVYHRSTKLTPSLASPSVDIPAHLTAVYEQIDWHGQDLDALITALNVSAPQLIGQLMELELLGAISEQGGRYLRL